MVETAFLAALSKAVLLAILAASTPPKKWGLRQNLWVKTALRAVAGRIDWDPRPVFRGDGGRKAGPAQSIRPPFCECEIRTPFRLQKRRIFLSAKRFWLQSTHEF
jgi:hypothetical protein